MSILSKNNKYSSLLVALGLLIIGYAIFIYFNSPELTYESRPSKNSVRFYVLIRILAGIVYTVLIVLIIKKRLFNTKNLIVVFCIGLLSRLILIPSEPILEDDFNRYLWDGAVTANGYNPFKYAPKTFSEQDTLNGFGPQKLHSLADSSEYIIDRINHPHIRTIYPPVAQSFFTIAYFIKPWSITVWKLLLFIIDLFVFYLLVLILKKNGKPQLLVAIYWLNPILLHEIFNAGHMDLIMYPLILLGILFLLKEKNIHSVSFFSLAVGVKIWPVIFIPFVLKKVYNNKKIFFTSIIVSTGIIFLILLPILLTKFDNSLGFVTYSKNWTNNESIFRLINNLLKGIIHLFNINYHCSLCLSRWVVIILFGFVLIYYLRKKENVPTDMINHFFLIVAIMFILSPTQFPWYYTWALPLLALNPRISFVAYSILLPFYQLKYSFPFLVWIEHLPIVGLFILEVYNKKLRDFLLPKNNI